MIGEEANAPSATGPEHAKRTESTRPVLQGSLLSRPLPLKEVFSRNDQPQNPR